MMLSVKTPPGPVHRDFPGIRDMGNLPSFRWKAGEARPEESRPATPDRRRVVRSKMKVGFHLPRLGQAWVPSPLDYAT
jgi:hypothetical protein